MQWLFCAFELSAVAASASLILSRISAKDSEGGLMTDDFREERVMYRVEGVTKRGEKKILLLIIAIKSLDLDFSR